MTSLLDILNQIPTSLVNHAKPILDIMLVSKSLMRWNRNLELVVKDDVVPDTNVPELIVHALQPIKMNERAPNGFSEFITCLGILGLESDYVENQYAVQVLDENSNSSDDDSSDDDNSDGDSSDDNNSDKNNDERESDDQNDEMGSDDENDKQESNDESDEQESENENDEQDSVDESDEQEEKPKVKWMRMVDGDGVEESQDKIDINSAGFYEYV